MKADAICIEGLLRWAAELSYFVDQIQKRVGGGPDILAF